MKRIMIALIVGLFALTAITSARLSLPATDSFIRTASTLGTNWSASSGAITDWVLDPINGARTTYAGADYIVDYWTADVFNADQYSQVQIVKGVNGYEGVAVRASAGGNSYTVTLEGGTGCKFYKFVSNTRSAIGSCALTWVDGNTLKLAVSGTSPATLTAYQNGVSRGTVTDSDLSSGSAGIIGYGDAGAWTNWEGGNIGGAVTLPSARLSLAPIPCCRLDQEMRLLGAR